MPQLRLCVGWIIPPLSSNIHCGPPQLIKFVMFGFWINRGEGFEILIKTNFVITIMSKIQIFSSLGPFFEEGGGVSKISARSWNFIDFLKLRVNLLTHLFYHISRRLNEYKKSSYLKPQDPFLSWNGCLKKIQ